MRRPYCDDSRWIFTELAADTTWKAECGKTGVSSGDIFAAWSAWLISYVGGELGKSESWYANCASVENACQSLNNPKTLNRANPLRFVTGVSRPVIQIQYSRTWLYRTRYIHTEFFTDSNNALWEGLCIGQHVVRCIELYYGSWHGSHNCAYLFFFFAGYLSLGLWSTACTAHVLVVVCTQS